MTFYTDGGHFDKCSRPGNVFAQGVSMTEGGYRIPIHGAIPIIDYSRTPLHRENGLKACQVFLVYDPCVTKFMAIHDSTGRVKRIVPIYA